MPRPSPAFLAADLRRPEARVRAGDFHRLDGLHLPGMYAWYVDQTGARDLSSGLGLTIRSGLIYAGEAGAGTGSATLASRVGRNHLRGNTYGSTFRFTLATVLRRQLRLRPTGGRRMDPAGEPRLSDWMLEHLSVAVAPFADRLALGLLETAVLAELDPPLNIAKMPPSPVRSRLSERRRHFRPVHDIGTAARTSSVAFAKGTTSRIAGPTPEELARELGLPNAKSIRAFLRREFPRPQELLRSRWGPLTPEQVRAIRERFGKRR